MLYSSNTHSSTAYGGPLRQLGSSEMDRVSIRARLGEGSTTLVTTCRASSEIATITRVPMSVQHHLRSAHQNSLPIANSSCLMIACAT